MVFQFAYFINKYFFIFFGFMELNDIVYFARAFHLYVIRNKDTRYKFKSYNFNLIAFRIKLEFFSRA